MPKKYIACHKNQSIYIFMFLREKAACSMYTSSNNAKKILSEPHYYYFFGVQRLKDRGK